MTLLSIGDVIVDEETGEIVDCPPEAGQGFERIDYFIGQYGFARQQEAAWGAAKGAYSALLQKLLTEAGIGSRKDAAGSVTVVPQGERVTAPAENLVKARAAELLTDSEVTEIAIAAAKDLDRDAVESWIASITPPEDADEEAIAAVESRKQALRAVLLNRSPRRAYVIVKPARVAAPDITRNGGAE